MLTGLLMGVMSKVVSGILSLIGGILHATILRPFTFNYSMVPAQIWHVTDHVAWLGAGVLFSYEAIQYMLHPWTGSQNAPSKLIGRTGLAILMAQSSYWSLGLMLTINNVMVTYFLAHFTQVHYQSAISAFAAAESMNLWILLVVVVFLLALIGMVVSWAARAGELLFFLAIAPIAAILSISERFQVTWRWLVGEFAVAAFSQAAWALSLMITFLAISGEGVIPAKTVGGTSGQVLINALVGLGCIVVSFNVQSKLKGLIFGQQGTSNINHGGAELAAAFAGAQLATGAFGPQIQAGLGAAGIGRYSEGGMRAMAGVAVRQAQVAAQPEFAAPMAQARAEGQINAALDPAARTAIQGAETMGHVVSSHPTVAAAQATRSAVTRSAPTAGAWSPEQQSEGKSQAQRFYQRVYGTEPNPYTAPPSEEEGAIGVNPYTGHTMQV